MSFRLFFILLLLAPCYAAFPQSGDLNFFQLDRHDGLSDNIITDIEADRDGFLWIGTSNGLNRYDGYEFTIYSTDMDHRSIPERNVRDIFRTSNGEFWVGFINTGIAKYDYQDQSFTHTNLIELPDLAVGSQFIGFCEDTEQNFYVLTTYQLYVRSAGDTNFVNIASMTSQLEGPDGDHLGEELTAITSDENEGIWIASSGGQIFRYSHNNHTINSYQIRNLDRAPRSLIISLLHFRGKLWIGGMTPQFGVFNTESQEVEVLLKNENLINTYQIKGSEEGGIWVASAGGLVHFDPASNDYRIYREDINSATSISSSDLLSVYEDPNGVYWFGTSSSGLNYSFRDLPFRKISLGEQHNDISEKNITALMHDNQNALWIGIGSGVIERHDPSGRYKQMHVIEAILDKDDRAGTIFKVYQGTNGSIYCSSWRGGIQKFDPSTGKFRLLFGSAEKYMEKIDAPDIRDIKEDEKGNLWISAHGKGVYMVNEETGIVKKYLSGVDSVNILNVWVYSIEIDQAGYVWVTSAYGLNRIDPKSGKVKWYSTDYSDCGLTSNEHNLITTDTEGHLWIGTNSGLNLYDAENDRFLAFNKQNGLPFEQVRGLIQDQNGTYWMSTPYGIVSFIFESPEGSPPRITSAKTYDLHDGLLQENYNYNCYSKSGNNSVYFGGTTGIDFFNPSQIKPYYSQPSILINDISVFGETVRPGIEGHPWMNEDSVLQLTHRQNMLSIEFIALNYFNNKGNIYSYKLEPANEDWIEIGSDRKLVFSNLSPGSYKLSLQVRTEDGATEIGEDILLFEIIPPFWKKGWFTALTICLLLFISFLIVWNYTRNLRKRKDELKKLVQERTKDLEISNIELLNRTKILNETNDLLTEKQTRIESQAKELRTQQETLSVRNKELQLLNSTKDKMFSIIAHDLKNPFGNISGFADLLYDQYDSYTDERRKELLLAVKESVDVTQDLLENLLHWSYSQTGRIRVNKTQVALPEIFARLERLFRPSMQQKELDLEFITERDLIVFTDPDLFNTILRNLISNALKFTSKGGMISVRAAKKDEGTIEIEVKDTGSGIEQDRIDSLFRIEQNTSTRGTEGEKGTGLGLLICKEFVDKMNAGIRVDSVVEKGTAVIITLPTEKSSQ